MFPGSPPVVIEYDFKAHAIHGDHMKECTEGLNALFAEGWEEYKMKKVGESLKSLVFLRRRKK